MDLDLTQPADRTLQLFDIARRGQQLAGRLPLALLTRLAASSAATAEQLQQLHAEWALRGWVERGAAGVEQPMLELWVGAELPLACQRCLQPVLVRLDDQVRFRLVEQEPELTLEELEAEDEALCGRGNTDGLQLVEDQLILALPLVALHPDCPPPRALQDQKLDSPFAALAALKRAD